jgi:hypothetical protein
MPYAKQATESGGMESGIIFRPKAFSLDGG